AAGAEGGPMRLWVPVLLGAICPAVVWAQVPAGGEFQVNTYTTYDQFFPSAAMDQEGNVIVVWESERGGVGVFGISGQRFDAAGVRRGSELEVSSGTSPFFSDAHVASAAKGSFVVAWHFIFNDSIQNVQGRRFSAAGVPLGRDFAGT